MFRPALYEKCSKITSVMTWRYVNKFESNTVFWMTTALFLCFSI